MPTEEQDSHKGLFQSGSSKLQSSLQDKMSQKEKNPGITANPVPEEFYNNQLLVAIQKKLIHEIDPAQIKNLKEDTQLTEHIKTNLDTLCEKEFPTLTNKEKNLIVNALLNEFHGLGPLQYLILDDNISEIMVNGYDQVYIEKKGCLTLTNTKFRDNEHVLQIIDKIVSPLGRRIDESSPMVDARLPDGSRVNAIIPPVSLKGPILTIRKFSAIPLTISKLISYNTLTEKMAAFLEAAVRAKVNIIVAGGTGSGKTTLLNVLSSFIPHGERIITIEDAAELRLNQPHVISLEARPPNIEGKGQITIRDLLRNSLRMRPDRIIIGEVRGAEALDMLQAMNTGHNGSLSTIHANSPRDALSRLETMVLYNGIDFPLRAIREQIASAINLIIYQERLSDGSRKITQISEVSGIEGEIITLQDIFNYQKSTSEGSTRGKFSTTSFRPKIAEKFSGLGKNWGG